MNSLPPELQAKVAAFLCPTDLRSLRLASRQLAAIAARPLFEVLRFSGRRQGEFLPWNSGPTLEYYLPDGHLGRTRVVELGRLQDAIEEILSSSIAQYTKKFVFDPASYRRGFWRDYRMLLINQMHEPVDEIAYDVDDPDGYEAAVERVLEHRRTRLEREAAVIEAAEAIWDDKAAEQEKNAGSIVAALIKLFQVMKTLERIDIRPWEFDGYPGLESCNSYMIDVQRRGTFPCTIFLEILARAMKSADRHIKCLHVSEFFAEHLHDTPATRHLFTGLQDLTLEILDVEFLSEEADMSQVLVELFKCAQPTLRRLSIVGGGKWPQLAARGEHSLLKMLGEGADESPLVFPRLGFVRLGGFIFSTPPLLRFLCAQPNLTRLEFRCLYLSTPGVGWTKLVEGFPASIESWEVNEPLGHEPVLGDGPTAYNWMTTWAPRTLPPTSGWKAIPRNYATYFERIS
ncbi:hypothetical protein F5Y19DRAFT_73100 [Xylariaceae sp. FL1651]|nr:hypothetical protein F5Y19DRAFT_73100 [Xylariaceae sp. FL1651]